MKNFEKIVAKNQAKLVAKVTKAYAKAFRGYNKRRARELKHEGALSVPNFTGEFHFVLNGMVSENFPDDLAKTLRERGFEVTSDYTDYTTVISRRYYPD